MQLPQPTALLALLTTLLPLVTSATPPAPAHFTPGSNPSVLLNLIAYEFPYCLASESSLLQNLFLSRPTDTKFVVNATTSSGSSHASQSECKTITASRGVPHSFFYTADGDLKGCELRTWEGEKCDGEVTVRKLDAQKGFSECFTSPKRFVKPLLRSGRVVCGGGA